MFGSIGKIAKSVTGIAKTVSGTTKNFRQVLAANPGALGIALPPQVSLGIKAANALGLKVPSQDVLTRQVMSELDKAVFGVYRPNSDDLIRALKGQKQSNTPGLDRFLGQLRKNGNPVLDKIDLSSQSVNDVINKIDWLL